MSKSDLEFRDTTEHCMEHPENFSRECAGRAIAEQQMQCFADFEVYGDRFQEVSRVRDKSTNPTIESNSTSLNFGVTWSLPSSQDTTVWWCCLGGHLFGRRTART